MNKVAIGTKVESEHKGTYNFLEEYHEKHHKLPNPHSLYHHIAMDHVREHPDYYSRLKKARL